MKHEIFVITEVSVTDYDDWYAQPKAFTNKEDAEKAFEKLWQDALNEWEDNEEDFEICKDSNSGVIYEDGDYTRNHYRIELNTIELQ